jgi:decaprenyl-phosphate phosphoribosyltransferase
MSTESHLPPLIRALRPQQWTKNLLVLGAAFFSGQGNVRSVIVEAVVATVAFCLLASGVYLFNDVRDRASDRQHPTRQFRPIASGAVSVRLALVTSAVLVGSAGAAAWWIGTLFAQVLGFYLVVNLVYSLGAKRIVILDVILVGLGFVLRAVAGAVAVDVVASSWIIVCTLELALLVVAGKRRHDLETAEASGTRHLLPPEWYTVRYLDFVMATAASAAIVTYALYTVDPETIERIGSRRLVLTVPMVVYGCLRYLFLTQTARASADPTDVLLRDRGLQLCGAAWALMAAVAVYA